MEKTDLFVDSCTHSPVLGTWISVSHHVVFPWFHFISISSVQSLSRVWLFATPWAARRQASLSIINSQSSPKLMSIVSDAIQPSHPLSSPSPPAFNLSQHQGLFQWVSSSHQVAKVLEFQFQLKHSFQWIFRTDFLLEWLVWSPGSPRDSQESSPTPQFKSNSSAFSFLYSLTLTSIHDYW